jgi:hypothetical protein
MCWMRKPDGTSYADFHAALARALPQDGSAALWMRQMVLGTPPEYCVHALEPVSLPGDGQVAMHCETIWP